MVPKEMKTCKKCGYKYPLTSEFFYTEKRGKDGFKTKCKKCVRKENNIKTKQYYQNNRERRLKYQHKYNRNHRKEIKKKRKEHSRKHREKLDKRNKEWRQQFFEETGIKYKAIHEFIRYNKKKPEYCTICNEIKDLDLASIGHTYTRNPKDWIYICRECHRLFDK